MAGVRLCPRAEASRTKMLWISAGECRFNLLPPIENYLEAVPHPVNASSIKLDCLLLAQIQALRTEQVLHETLAAIEPRKL